MRETLTRLCDTSSGKPIKRVAKARMLPCLYFQLSCLMVLEVNARTLSLKGVESSSKMA